MILLSEKLAKKRRYYTGNIHEQKAHK